MNADSIRKDLAAAAAVSMMAVPQGVAYAMIAGLPPATGLYAAAVPTVLASAARSSSHVVTGPTNALSLLVGGALAAGLVEGDPILTAMLLAAMVGGIQIAAGLLRLGAVVDYISRAVVLGYITGAGLLIGFGQLGNITGTSMGKGDPFVRLQTWASGLGGADWRPVAVALGSILALLWLRKKAPKAPGAILVLGVSILLSWLLDFKALGLATAGDLAPVPAGLPPFHVPTFDLHTLQVLLPVAFAATVLSLVESSAVARSIAATSGERLDMNREFVGQGLGNLGAGFMGGYPVSGSLSRSALNYRAGAVSRLSGVASGAMMVLVLLLFGPIVDLTPVAALAGLLIVVAWDLVDTEAIRYVMHAPWGDRSAFLVTAIGPWTLSLDTAIYFGVGISIFMFLRRARNLRVTDLVIDRDGHIRESAFEGGTDGRLCKRVHAIHVEGNLFFGAAGELQDALDEATSDPAVKVLVVRLKRARGLDFTTAGVLLAARERLRVSGRHLILAGMKPETMHVFEHVGITEAFGDDLFPTESTWFAAMNRAIKRGLELTGVCEDCPLAHYIEEAVIPPTEEAWGPAENAEPAVVPRPATA
ncbi:MAG: SulP family inorganic anion transporter [Alphaproteobacteria bacterium]|nr:SulP family inorganic anion transporter [Alphaproteobacteria bacterium]